MFIIPFNVLIVNKGKPYSGKFACLKLDKLINLGFFLIILFSLALLFPGMLNIQCFVL